MLSIVTFKLFFAFVLATLAVIAAQNVHKLGITVYYDSGCRYSGNFIRKLLQPSMRIKNRLQYTDLKLVPYGGAKISKDNNTGQLIIKCDFGELDCEGNALNACVLDNAEIGTALDFLACFFTLQPSDLLECATKTKLNLEPVMTCKFNRSNADILQKYGQETPLGLQFVPAIEIDGVLDFNQSVALNSDKFDAKFCELYAKKFGQHLPDCPDANNDEADNAKISFLGGIQYKGGHTKL